MSGTIRRSLRGDKQRSFGLRLCWGLMLWSGCGLLAGACAPPLPPLSQSLNKMAQESQLGVAEAAVEPFYIQHKWLGFKRAYAHGVVYQIGAQMSAVRSPEAPNYRWPCALKDTHIPSTVSRHLRSGWGHHAQDLRGDWVNLMVLVSDRAQLISHFQVAGWVQPSLRAYLKSPWQDDNAFPISPLLLWSRPQDLAFSRDTRFNLSQRHHLRLWKSPWRCGAAEVWIGTASRDASIEWSPFGWRGGITTHRIDPDIDRERRFVLHTFAAVQVKGHYVARKGVTTPVEGLNGNLDPYVSDGQLAVLDLRKPQEHPLPTTMGD